MTTVTNISIQYAGQDIIKARVLPSRTFANPLGVLTGPNFFSCRCIKQVISPLIRNVGPTDVPNPAVGAIPGQDILGCYTWIVEKTYHFLHLSLAKETSL